MAFLTPTPPVPLISAPNWTPELEFAFRPCHLEMLSFFKMERDAFWYYSKKKKEILKVNPFISAILSFHLFELIKREPLGFFRGS